jgi:PadR family transcriptional regulator PadR
MNAPQSNKNTISLEDNLKKALTELLVLHLLSQRDYYIGELTTTLSERSGGALTIVFPYGAIYRLQQSQFIMESQKRTAPDGRRRQYFSITPTGMTYLKQLRKLYTRFIRGVDQVLESEAD